MASINVTDDATLVASKPIGGARRRFGVFQNRSEVDIAIGFTPQVTFGAGDYAGIIVEPDDSISFALLSGDLDSINFNLYAIAETEGPHAARWIER